MNNKGKTKEKHRQFIQGIAYFAATLFFIMSLSFCTQIPAAASDTSSSSTTTSTSTSTSSSSTTSSTSSSSDDSSNSGSSSSSSGSSGYSSVYSTSEYIKPGNYWATPVCKYGEPVIVALPIVNMTPYNVKQVVVTPVISGKTEDWPFEINASGYTISFDCLLGSNAQPDINERTQYLYWTFMTREDVLNGYYPLSFQILYLDDVCNQGSATISTYVECIGKPDAANKNIDENMAVSTPRIIVTGFETNPADVYAGSDFELIIHLKNTSDSTEVSNVEIDLTAAVEGKDSDSSYSAFLPTSGSNTAYFSEIPIQGSADIRMSFNAKADLAQKPYVMKLDMKYEDKKNNPYTGEASVSIPVRQDSRFEISTIEMTPASITIGGQANVMFSVYNTGKTKLYNLKADFSADSITNANAFVGNLDSGATGNIDTMLTGINPTTDDGTVKVTVSYENDMGEIFSEDFNTTLYVNPPMGEFGVGGEDGMGGMEAAIRTDPNQNKFSMETIKNLPLWAKIAIPIGIFIIVTGVIGAIISGIRKRKRKKELQIEELD